MEENQIETKIEIRIFEDDTVTGRLEYTIRDSVTKETVGVVHVNVVLDNQSPLLQLKNQADRQAREILAKLLTTPGQA